MKFIFVAGMIVIANSIYASSFHYVCNSVDNNQPYSIERLQLYMNQTEAHIKFLNSGLGQVSSEQYFVSEYQNGAQSKPSLKLELNQATSRIRYPEGPLVTFFAEKELASGGYKLRNGAFGGFVKVTGSGYRWANYICSRTN